MKTQEELNALRAEYEGLYKKLAGLSAAELNQVVNGNGGSYAIYIKYTIQPGDSLTAIAGRYKCTVAELTALNKIQNANLIKAYETILVPAKA